MDETRARSTVTETAVGPSAKVKTIDDDDDTAGDDNLSPPPSESMSPPSSVNLNALEDEIVVGANANGTTDKSSPLRVVSENEDDDMADAEDVGPVASHYPKRKRASLYQDMSEETMSYDIPDEADALRTKLPKKPLSSGVKGVIIGYWRDSPIEDIPGKHSVIGFIDVRDRLRTRIQQSTRSGQRISDEFPFPPGPGGSWVQFERIVFEDHLVGLNNSQVKEYVKLRVNPTETTEEERKAAELAAVSRARDIANANPPPDTAPPPSIAYGAVLPDAATRTDNASKRRRTSTGFATINTPAAAAEPQPLSPLDMLPGTRPTRIMVGYWSGSSEPEEKDRHAVYGILGQNDMFRVKVVRETRDGRFVDGNFPTGAGALWIHYEEVHLEPHLASMNRSEVKEYCRVRQRQLDEGEVREDREANEAKAVVIAKQRAAQGYRPGVVVPQTKYLPIASADDHAAASELTSHELRQQRRTDPRPARHALPDSADSGLARRRSADMVERTNSIARREIARAEAAQSRADRHAANREAIALASAAAARMQIPLAPGSPAPRLPGQTQFAASDEMQRLNNVWARQEAHRLKAGAEDAKIYAGVKYERKRTGPFEGRFVSQGTIISIDGEDYVEYRVLTKPSFF